MQNEIAILAGGCFWGVEGLFQRQAGVISTRVGYTGGELATPTYNDVKTGITNHAEAIEIIFDPAVTSYRKILLYFFQIHDPTTKNRQGNDVGTQYRSEIFYMNEDQKDIAMQVMKEVEEDNYWGAALATKLSPASTFWQAEDFHQDYLLRTPNGYTCHFPRNDWTLVE